MQQVDVRYRATGKLPEREIGRLLVELPRIVAKALSIPGGRQYVKDSIIVEPTLQSTHDLNIPPIRIRIFASYSKRQYQRRDEVTQQIVREIVKFLGPNVVGQASICLLLLPSSSRWF